MKKINLTLLPVATLFASTAILSSCNEKLPIVEQCSIIFICNEGSFSDGTHYKWFKVNKGTKLSDVSGTIEIEPSRNGYTFENWITQTGIVDDTYVVNQDAIIEPVWQYLGNPTTLTLDANGGTFTKSEDDKTLEIETTDGTEVFSALYKATKHCRIYPNPEIKDDLGQYFDHWSTEKDKDVPLDVDNPIKVPSEGLTLYARYFKPIQPEEVSNEGIVLLKNNNNALPLTSDETSKTLHIFGLGGYRNGWRFQGNGSGRGFDRGDVGQDDEIDLIDAFRKNKEYGGKTNFTLNENLVSKYTNLELTSFVPVSESPSDDYKLCEANPEDVKSWIDNTKQTADISGDTALVVLSRYGGEGNDLPKMQKKYTNVKGSTKVDDAVTWVTDKEYSEITDEEQEMLDSVCDAGFKKVIVLLNVCNPMESGFLDDERISAALYMPTSGARGTLTVPKVLDGTVNPSGHLTDTIAYDLKTSPTYANMSWEAYTPDVTRSFDDDIRYQNKRFKDHANEYIHYTAYEENIYEGYRWYETADKMGYWNDSEKYPNGYESVVQYPFGYGLSYTNFSWTASAECSSGQSFQMKADEYITVKVTVKNIGNVAGKDVVQLYVNKPYFANGIEKASTELVGFAKTKLLQPQESETVVIRTRIADWADYDCYDQNKNGFAGYELERAPEGSEYTFDLRTDAHTNKIANVFKGNVAFGTETSIKYDRDIDTNYPVRDLFTNYKSNTIEVHNTDKHPKGGVCRSIDGSDFNNVGINATYLTRSDFANTYPTQFLDIENMGSDYESTYKVLDPWDDYKGEIHHQDIPNNYKIDDMIGRTYDDPKWDKLLNELSYQEMMDLVSKGDFGTISIDKINKPETQAMDGPCGFVNPGEMTEVEDASPTVFPSDTMIGCTWNIDIAHDIGKTMGFQGRYINGGLTENYGPGLNIHRSPLGGRNFEYYSEDPYLSGTMCSWQVSGAKEEGMTTYIKHIMLNDSDSGRNGRYNFTTEQALRQIYAKPFEIVVKGAKKYTLNSNNEVVETRALKANAMMGSVDRIGTTRVTGSYNLLTEMLRNEWGFRGSVITDYYQAGNVNDVDECIRSGTDLMLNGANNCEYDDITSNTFKYYIRQAAKNVLFTYIDTLYCSFRY